MRKRKVNIITLGCSKNVVDSEKLLKQIDANGFEVIWDSEENSGGTVIINTCGFINSAKEESINTILHYVEAKKSGKIGKLLVTGCLSERYKALLEKEIPEVDRYFGVNSMNDILKELGKEPEYGLLNERIITGPGHYAYLKIAEGCDRRCAFCTIPNIRGKYVSRPMKEIVEEANNLARKGVRELILIAQDLCYYGLDIYKSQKLPELIERLLEIESLDWIRLHYLFPSAFPSELIPLMKENKRICKYIDIPIQHISDKMLRLMKRGHNRNETLALLYKLRRELPDSAIRTTLITGHPGETKADYDELKKFISEFRFERLGIFAYSHEEGTYSYKNYSDTIADSIKESRLSDLMRIQQSISYRLNQALAGKVMKVLIDRREDSFLVGRTEYDSPGIDQEVLISAEYNLRPGDFHDILITGTAEFDLFGKPV